MENPIKMDDLGVPLFLETSIWLIFIYLVGGFLTNPFEKIWSSNWILSPSNGENNKYLKPPPNYG